MPRNRTLHEAVQSYDRDMFRLTLTESRRRSLRDVKRLCRAGADPNEPDEEGWTPFHWASKLCGMEDVLYVLEEYGASDDVVNADGLRPSALAHEWHAVFWAGYARRRQRRLKQEQEQEQERSQERSQEPEPQEPEPEPEPEPETESANGSDLEGGSKDGSEDEREDEYDSEDESGDESGDESEDENEDESEPEPEPEAEPEPEPEPEQPDPANPSNGFVCDSAMRRACLVGTYDDLEHAWSLSPGADPHETDGENNTWLHQAIRSLVWNPDIRDAVAKVHRFCDAGVNPNAVNVFGDTPLHDAAGMALLPLIQALLARGASDDVLNDEGKRPSDLTPDDALEDTNACRAFWKEYAASSRGFGLK